MPELRALHASFNQLTGVLPAAWAAPALQQLGVRANMFAGPLPAALASLPALAVLDLQVLQGRHRLWLTGSRPKLYMGCTALKCFPVTPFRVHSLTLTAVQSLGKAEVSMQRSVHPV